MQGFRTLSSSFPGLVSSSALLAAVSITKIYFIYIVAEDGRYRFLFSSKKISDLRQRSAVSKLAWFNEDNAPGRPDGCLRQELRSQSAFRPEFFWAWAHHFSPYWDIGWRAFQFMKFLPRLYQHCAGNLRCL